AAGLSSLRNTGAAGQSAFAEVSARPARRGALYPRRAAVSSFDERPAAHAHAIACNCYRASENSVFRYRVDVVRFAMRPPRNWFLSAPREPTARGGLREGAWGRIYVSC